MNKESKEGRNSKPRLIIKRHKAGAGRRGSIQVN